MTSRQMHKLMAAKGVFVRGVSRSAGVQGWGGVRPQQREIICIKIRYRREERLVSRSRLTQQLLGEEASLFGGPR